MDEVLNQEQVEGDAPPMVKAINRAAKGMASVSDLASRLLCAYVSSGGASWANLDAGHARKALQIANAFMYEAEGMWAGTMEAIKKQFTEELEAKHAEMVAKQDTGGGGGGIEDIAANVIDFPQPN